ncbi:MAG: class II aldolase/adducin family protein [Clostridiales bacterium]|nr:class II aldolase/adducin family protein [Clostridiales bacterium]
MNQKYPDNDTARNLLTDYGRRVYNKGFVAANDGNISLRVSANMVWITPSGVSKGYMDPDMMIKLDLNGKILHGGLKPSTETCMHLNIYRANREIGAIVHAHPPAATAFAVSGMTPDFRILPEAIVNLGEIPLAPYLMPSSDELAELAAKYSRDYNCVLLSNHGAITWGENIETAYFRMETLEYLANLCITTGRLGKAIRLNDEQITALMDKKNR